MKTLSTYRVNQPTTTSGHSISITTTIFGTEEEVEYLRQNCAEIIGSGLVQEYSSPLTSQFSELNRGKVVPDILQGFRYEERPQGEWVNHRNDYCHGIVNCKYYQDECVFMYMGSGNPDDMPCRVQEQSVISEFRKWKEEKEREEQTEVKGDLISREALKKAIKDNGYSHYFEIFDIIDNAPTVETFTKDDMSGAYNEGYACGSRENKRPQGEWIIDGHHYKCSQCGKTLAIMFSETDDDDLIGCPFCLSKMKGGAE